MANLVEHTIINKFITETKDAIEDVGGNLNGVCPCDYPNAIRTQLSAGGSSGSVNLEEGEGITLEKTQTGWKISSNSNGVLIGSLSPTYPEDKDIPAGTSIQKTFEILFDDVLPVLPSILKGDIIIAANNGTDQYQHPKFGNGIASGLTPDIKYIRIYIASQQEPIYISCELIDGAGGSIYTGSDGDNIKINVDNQQHIISAELTGNITSNMISDEDKLTGDDAENIFDEIFK